MEDSLGKRLFQDELRSIKGEGEGSQGSEAKGSQVSLNLSLSNDDSKGQEGAIGCLQPQRLLQSIRQSGSYEQ